MMSTCSPLHVPETSPGLVERECQYNPVPGPWLYWRWPCLIKMASLRRFVFDGLGRNNHARDGSS